MTTSVGAVGLRERKKARTREALEEAALDFFSRQGFDQTTIEEIADACEVSPRTFFRYYPTKEAVLFADGALRRERLLSVIAHRPADEPALLALHAGMRELALDYQDDRSRMVARAAKIVKASLHLQVYQAEHQHGWEADVVAALEGRGDGAAADHDELQLLTAVGDGRAAGLPRRVAGEAARPEARRAARPGVRATRDGLRTSRPLTAAHSNDEHVPDPRRWITLFVAVAAALILVLDTSVLTVAIPTIVRDFDTTLPTVEWVITGYALVFASLLIIGGRLGDVYGHRRVFIVGAAIFGSGSLLAALSWSVGALIVGEAIIEGVGAAIMLPATLAVLSTTFEGRERATAFALWGATVGVGVALGPVLGGFLTTNFTWRWAFGINVVMTPLAILGAMVFMRRDRRPARRVRIDVPGACPDRRRHVPAGVRVERRRARTAGSGRSNLSASRGSRCGRPIARCRWFPLVMLVAVLVLFAFVRLERWKERQERDPLFEFGQLRHRSFRYGLCTTSVLAMGQLGVTFVLSVYLQDAVAAQCGDDRLLVAPDGARDHRGIAGRRLPHPSRRRRCGWCRLGCSGPWWGSSCRR